MKYTKIVCTIGPASEKLATIKKLFKAGMNVARLNFSHGTHEQHARLIHTIRKAAHESGENSAILQDLQGPRIRIGEVDEGGVELKDGEHISLVPQSHFSSLKNKKALPTHFTTLSQSVRPGNHILIADGEIDLKVLRVAGPEIICSVTIGGVVKSHKGINVPGASFTVPSITTKDKEDLLFGIQHEVDFVALSFVRTAQDIRVLKSAILKHTKKYPHAKKIGILAKIERPEAVENFDEILELVDGIMIARGDLGIELPPEHVPIIQKQLIHKCMYAGKPVIVATQMMESMMTKRRASRSDISDVANAVIDHTDAVMLSGESATGKYPVETVQMMTKTIHETEKSRYDDYTCDRGTNEKRIYQILAHAASHIALTKSVRGIVIESPEPQLAREVASHRPELRIYASPMEVSERQKLALVRGVSVFPHSSDARKFLVTQKKTQKGDLILFVKNNGLSLEEI